jgi:large subunit ribosomal protein L22
VLQDQVKLFQQDKMENKNKLDIGHIASARSLNIPVSTKHCIEISKYLRNRNTKHAITFLEDVSKLKKAVSFKTFTRDLGHKAGMAAGRYPQKAAKEFLILVKSVQANAQVKGLNTSNLKITKLLANKASIPVTGGRRRGGTKRTHLEIEVQEGKDKLKKGSKKVEKKVEGIKDGEPKTKETIIKEAKVETNKVEETNIEIKNPEVKFTENKVEGNLENKTSEGKEEVKKEESVSEVLQENTNIKDKKQEESK